MQETRRQFIKGMAIGAAALALPVAGRS
ncbi:twin-arginine translocation signal domain-containing protein, partial [Bordetella pertussis]